jgi:lipoate-protein ligase A
VLEHGAGDGGFNMQVDIELFAGAEQGERSLRFYSWDGPWVSLGRFQSPDRDLVDAGVIPWVMRPTGGKAVLHGHDLTITIACPHRGDGVKTIYRSLIAPLVRGLQSAGLAAALGEETPFVGTGNSSDCFRHVSANDVVDRATGRKLIGCALKVTRYAALAQCSIPLSMPLIDPARVYRDPHIALPLAVQKEVLVASMKGAYAVQEFADSKS